MAPATSFIHLHNHSEYSILDGAVRIKDLVAAADEHGMPAVALTDHGNIFGAVQFFKEAKKKNIKPILGCELYVAPGSRKDRQADSREQVHFHLVVLVQNDAGYRNLCKLLTSAYLEGFYYRPRVDKEILARHSEGLIALSSCLKGEVAFLLGKGLDEAAEEAAASYAAIFGKDRFFIEIQDHGIALQKETNPKLIRIARKLGLGLVATNDVHYRKKDDAESHDVLLCIQTNRKVTDPERIKFQTQEFYFKSREEMAALFPEVPEAIETTSHIAAMCDFELPLAGHFLPSFKPPAGMNLQEYFERVAGEGFAERRKTLERKAEAGQLSHPLEEYERRLATEIRLIEHMQFEGYFLIVWDLIRAARAAGIPVGPGRGSAAGSLLAWSLSITDVDPIEYDLLFERFLNPERISLPDIDIDFCARRREEVIAYVMEKYGRDNVSQIITFGTMAAKAAIRDVGRALDVPLPEVDRIAKMIPIGPDVTIEKSIEQIAPLKELRDKNPKIAHLLEIARKVEGQVRHPSIHAAGLVITPRPIAEFLPLYKSTKDEITTQFEMGDVEAIGLLKMDILGLRNLTVIDDSLALIKKDLGETVDLKALPNDDPKTFDLFRAGATDGVFQFESRGMKELLLSYKPDEFRDLIALNALYRPGPLKSGMTAEFVKRKHHPEEVKFDIPEIEPILRETRGIIVYQEQVMRIAVELAGFSLAEADVLRKAMGKKVAEMMRQQKEGFLKGVRKKGLVASDKAKALFENIKNFAEYGFNKSHSAAYAALAYQTAYLKAHYPVHYMAALLTSEAERGATDQVVKYIAECQRMGIAVLPPDINESDFRFTVAGPAVRFGLAAVKNVGESAAQSLVQIRAEHGRFVSPFDVGRHADAKFLNRRVLESLIKAGAFDSLGWKRSQCFHLIDRISEFAKDLQKARIARQSLLFGAEAAGRPEVPDEVRTMNEWNESLMLSYEKDALGFFITGHPLSQFRNLGRLASHTVAELEEEGESGIEVRLAGIIAAFRPLKTRKDERMAAFFLEDLTGRIEVLAFPEAFKKNFEHLHEDRLVWLKGKLMSDGENRKIQLVQVMPLAEAFEKQARRAVVRIFVPGIDLDVMGELKDILEKHPGACPLYFELEMPFEFKLVVQSVDVKGVAPSDELARTVDGLLGGDSFVVDY
jgi:DNA polymerase-3 subunit alpha